MNRARIGIGLRPRPKKTGAMNEVKANTLSPVTPDARGRINSSTPPIPSTTPQTPPRSAPPNTTSFQTPQTHIMKDGTPLATRRVFKVIIIGDPNVGKTCLSFRFCNGRFPEKTEATIGVDFRERVLTIDAELIRIQLWDTAGQERFRQSMTAHYYRNVHAIVFVYDVTKAKSFQNLSHWIAECRRHHVNFKSVPALLIGNKCDCNDEVAVPISDAQRFADSQDMPLFETSAKADSEADHVESIFMTLVHKLKDSKRMSVQSNSIEGKDLVKIEASPDPITPRSKCAC